MHRQIFSTLKNVLFFWLLFAISCKKGDTLPSDTSLITFEAQGKTYTIKGFTPNVGFPGASIRREYQDESTFTYFLYGVDLSSPYITTLAWRFGTDHITQTTYSIPMEVQLQGLRYYTVGEPATVVLSNLKDTLASGTFHANVQSPYSTTSFQVTGKFTDVTIE